METQKLIEFRNQFEQERNRLLLAHELLDESLNMNRDDMIDESDFTSSENERSMRMRLRRRETLYLKKIEEALSRISSGTFGDCESCADEIEDKRLQARPTATLCMNCKEEQERQETLHIDGHRSKSLGFNIRLA